MSLRAGLAGMLALAVVLVSCWTARAESTATHATVILIDPGLPVLSLRLREEIESLGLSVAVVDERDPAEPLDLRARAAGAIAAIRVTRHGVGSVEMTIADRTTGKTVSRRLDIVVSTDPASAELVATRTVELLRASLMELDAGHPARGDVPVTPQIEALAPEPRPSDSLAVSAAVGPALGYERSSGTTLDAWLDAAVLWPSGVGLTGRVFVPISRAQLESREGSVELSTSLYALGGVLEISPPRRPVVARIRAGALLARLALNGTAVPPYVGSNEQVLASGPWLGAGFVWQVTRNLGAVLSVDAAYCFPRVVIRVAGHPVATWGRPLGAAALGLEWRSP
jgi:hypothetical protein